MNIVYIVVYWYSYKHKHLTRSSNAVLSILHILIPVETGQSKVSPTHSPLKTCSNTFSFATYRNCKHFSSTPNKFPLYIFHKKQRADFHLYTSSLCQFQTCLWRWATLFPIGLTFLIMLPYMILLWKSASPSFDCLLSVACSIWVCISLLLPRLPKFPCQCYLSGPGNLDNLHRNKEIHPE